MQMAGIANADGWHSECRWLVGCERGVGMGMGLETRGVDGDGVGIEGAGKHTLALYVIRMAWRVVSVVSAAHE